MSYPIIIAAKNEESYIGNTLESLSVDTYPIVITNGCEDATAEIADSYGAKVIELEESSKMAALKAGIRAVASNVIVEGVSVLDADTRLLSKSYVSQINKSFGSVACGVLVSPMLFETDKSTAVGTSLWKEISRKRYERSAGQSFVHGANLIMRPGSSEVVERVLELDDKLWPHEDVAIVDIFREVGEEVSTYNLRAGAITNLRGHISLPSRLLRGSATCDSVRRAWMKSRGPSGAIAYSNSKESTNS